MSAFLPLYAKTDLVVLDDWGWAPLTDEHRGDLLELLDERHAGRGTLVASQFLIDHWHAAIGEPTPFLTSLCATPIRSL